jgi:hypothetical protein
MTPASSNVDQRLAAVERQCRRWKYLGLVSLILCTLVAVPAGAVFVTDFLVARGLFLTDAANRRAVVDAVDDGGNGFRAFVNPNSGRVQAAWATTSTGASFFSQHDLLGRSRYVTIVNADGSAVSGMLGPNGLFRAAVFQDASGTSVYAVFDGLGQVIRTLP